MVETYENLFYNGADGWQTNDIKEHVLHYCDPMKVLKCFITCTVQGKNFIATPFKEGTNPRVYSTRTTRE